MASVNSYSPRGDGFNRAMNSKMLGRNAYRPALYHGLVGSPGFGFSRRSTKLHLLVHKNRAAFADVFGARNRDNRFTIIRKIDDAFVIYAD